MDATLNITLLGQNGDLSDLVPFDASDDEIRAWAIEAIRGGHVPGIVAQEADFTDFVVDRISAREDFPNRLFLRPKTPFGVTLAG